MSANVGVGNDVTTLLESLAKDVDYIHRPKVPDAAEERYFTARGDPDVVYVPHWTNFPEFGGVPKSSRRSSIAITERIARVSVLDIPTPIFDVSEVEMPLLDYYEITSSAFMISDKLRNQIEAVDPHSLDCVQAEFQDFVPEHPYWLCMPARTLEAVDASRTLITIAYELFGERKFRRLHFPEGVMIDHNVTLSAAIFADIDNSYWFWSRELIDQALKAGIRGMSFAKAGDPADRRIEVR